MTSAAMSGMRSSKMARLNLKYVNSFEDRHGRWRHYFRRRGSKPVPLPGEVGSEEFMTKYAALLSGDDPASVIVIGARKTSPGTVNALAVAHYTSAYFKGLALVTQTQ